MPFLLCGNRLSNVLESAVEITFSLLSVEQPSCVSCGLEGMASCCSGTPSCSSSLLTLRGGPSCSLVNDPLLSIILSAFLESFPLVFKNFMQSHVPDILFPEYPFQFGNFYSYPVKMTENEEPGICQCHAPAC